MGGLGVSVGLAALALGRLIAISQRRALFVSAVTHELRIPLTTFRLYTDLLQRDMVPDADARREYFQTLRHEADRLMHLVDNVLRYSKLQQTSSPMAMETVRVSRWIARVRNRMEHRLLSADMSLELFQSSDGDWRTDPIAIEQVLFNLVDNAAKYATHATDRRVHIGIDVEPTRIVIEVTDHGNGVPDDFGSSLFRPFTKSAERAAETAAGVGLGLALAKQTMAALGGRITYQRADDGGASFRMSLPKKNHAANGFAAWSLRGKMSDR